MFAIIGQHAVDVVWLIDIPTHSVCDASSQLMSNDKGALSSTETPPATSSIALENFQRGAWAGVGKCSGVSAFCGVHPSPTHGKAP